MIHLCHRLLVATHSRIGKAARRQSSLDDKVVTRSVRSNDEKQLGGGRGGDAPKRNNAAFKVKVISNQDW